MHEGITRREFCSAIGASSIALGTRRFVKTRTPPRKPNIDHLICDDLGWGNGLRSRGFEILQVLPTLTDNACPLIRNRAVHPEVPFFFYFALPSPHCPRVPLPEFEGKSRAGGPQDQLYKLRNDPGEIDNQWLNRPELLQRLTVLLEGCKNSGRSSA
jgi:hypothetical protein